MPDVLDVLVVGGGPAGSTCARRLVQAGLDVALIDKARFPRDKVCAGWITPAVVRALELDLDDYARSRTLQPFTAFETGVIGGRLRQTTFDRVVSFGIRRCEFDEYLLTRSAVRRLDEEPVREIERNGDAWLVNRRIRARLLVGAGGHFCPVARVLNPGASSGRVIAAQEMEFELDDGEAAACGVAGPSPELYFWPDFSGYAWCVRKGRVLNIGAGVLAPGSLPRAIQEFSQILDRRGHVLPAGRPAWKGHAYLLNRTSSRRLTADGALLVGDSAGLALAPSGEGILTAVESGLMAADVIAQARHDYSAARLEAYSQLVERRLGPHGVGLSPLPGWLASAASAVVLGSRWLTRRLLLEHGFLHVGRPGLPADTNLTRITPAA